jgi:hypothetical protein
MLQSISMLSDFLDEYCPDSIVLSFEELLIICQSLPQTAYDSNEWWDGWFQTRSHDGSSATFLAKADVEARDVEFQRLDESESSVPGGSFESSLNTAIASVKFAVALPGEEGGWQPPVTEAAATTPTLPSVGLISGGFKGLASGGRPYDFSTNPLYQLRRQYMERKFTSWTTLSSLHLRLHPSIPIESDVNLARAKAPVRRWWSNRVLGILPMTMPIPPSSTVEIHASRAYTDFGLVEGLESQEFHVIQPIRGMSVSEQFTYYRDYLDRA